VLKKTYLFEVSTMQSHVAIQGRDILELAVTKVAFHRLGVYNLATGSSGGSRRTRGIGV